ncbi:MAG: histidine triad nucleotide-binding protein [Actinomycetes bacterium]|jgi:histidine triad (HIT) family protein|nr:histidine triad nucleotide-binding protein [Actinomycetes bacterium]
MTDMKDMNDLKEMKDVNDCIFCNIASGEMDVPLVYEDELVVAFDDVSPQAPVHTLIVPKQHVASLNDDPDPALLAAVFGAAREVARLKGIADSGYRLVQNNGADAGQTVHHLHVHVLGGAELSVQMS